MFVIENGGETLLFSEVFECFIILMCFLLLKHLLYETFWICCDITDEGLAPVALDEMAYLWAEGTYCLIVYNKKENCHNNPVTPYRSV